MKYQSEQELLVEKGERLAKECARSGVRENDLGMVLAHLKRHQDPKATVKLLKALERSTFAGRNRGTREQLTALHTHARLPLNRAKTWREAAQIVGWAKRLMAVHAPRGKR